MRPAALFPSISCVATEVINRRVLRHDRRASDDDVLCFRLLRLTYIPMLAKKPPGLLHSKYGNFSVNGERIDIYPHLLSIIADLKVTAKAIIFHSAPVRYHRTIPRG